MNTDAYTPAEVTESESTCVIPLLTFPVFLNIGEKKAAQPYYISFFKAWMAGWMVGPALTITPCLHLPAVLWRHARAAHPRRLGHAAHRLPGAHYAAGCLLLPRRPAHAGAHGAGARYCTPQ